MKDICIFPIPGCVTFPGTVFPLHVFEPRYREMIRYCLDTQTPVAICHTRKMLSPGKQNDSLREALSTNQATYRPYDVFSAGLCELNNVTEDGRMYLDVHISDRYRMVSEKQTLPFQVYGCEIFSDRVADSDEQRRQDDAQNQLLKDKILHRLHALLQQKDVAAPAISRMLNSDEWQQKSPLAFSFELFGLVGFDAEILQTILEMDSAGQRLSYTLELLNEL